MKKIIFILIVLYLGVNSYAQREIHDTLFKTSVSKDTTVFRVFKRDVAYVELDVTTLSDNDTITIGMSADKSALIPVPVGSAQFPLKLTKANIKSTVNGTTKYRLAVCGQYWYSKYLGVRIKYAGTVGTVKPSLIWNQ